ncbi:Nramp family divalent metal transporter [Streptomyces sp. NPDC005373]|uniref:Nramp family divalent metal transporter n=1 Tax=Streptomyces sp. NPDC005373 TaxID=3156879 RepID=UPI0033BB3EF2
MLTDTTDAGAAPGPGQDQTRDPGPGSVGTLDTVLASGRSRALLTLLGPAFVASVAYLDPGNFATNFQAGAHYGYLLLWVVLGANLCAMPVQYLSAKLGTVTGCTLPELVRVHYPRSVALGLWVQAEVMAMATDVAEFLGAALGLHLLFGVSMFPAGLMTGAVALGLLGLQARGRRAFERAIIVLLAVVFAGFAYETLHVGPSVSRSLHGLLPRLDGSESLYLAVGIIGATVMPHAVYLHSALTRGRVTCHDDRQIRRMLRFERLDVVIALGLAGLVNMAMLAVAARLFHVPGLSALTSLEVAHTELGHLAGGAAALAFAAALLASGLSSASVGTYAGQVVMSGFTTLRIPLGVRRVLTMVPALAILALGTDATGALVLSQVVLSFGIPFALVPLVLLTSRRDVLGRHVNGPVARTVAWAVVSLITALNVFLIGQQFTRG